MAFVVGDAAFEVELDVRFVVVDEAEAAEQGLPRALRLFRSSELGLRCFESTSEIPWDN